MKYYKKSRKKYGKSRKYKQRKIKTIITSRGGTRL